MSAVEDLQAAMLALPQAELPTESLFHAGMYLRAVEMPADGLIVGKVHKCAHFLFLASGTLRIGQDTFHAPRVIPSNPGTKRALYAVTDCLFFTIHRTDTTDVASAEAEMVEPDETSPFLVGNKLPEKALT